MERLQGIAAVWGPAGREQKIRETLQTQIAPYVSEVRTDRFGNLIATRRGKPGAKKVMLAAHMDTAGIMAADVTDKGLIRIMHVGSLKAPHLLGQRVIWESGAIGFIQHEGLASGEVDFKRLWCDIGVSNREEALGHVKLGDICVLDSEVRQVGEFLAGASLDNRAGCAILLQVAESLSATEHEVIFAFTCQNEPYGRGAGVAAYGIDPDIAFVIDLAPASDVPGALRTEMKMGGGPGLRLKGAGYLAHQGVSDLVRGVAEEHAIPLQWEIAGYDDQGEARAVTVAGQGIAVGALNLPVRYRGTSGAMLHPRDMESMVLLLQKLLGSALL